MSGSKITSICVQLLMVYILLNTQLYCERWYSLIVDVGELEPDHETHSANMKRHEEEGSG